VKPESGRGPAIPPEAEARLRAAFRFGADEEAVRAEQRNLVPHFTGCQAVLDIGCGRGVMLDLFKEAGIGAEGVDHMPEAVAYCRAKGHRAEVGDAIDFLEERSEQYDGIFCSHVIEHLDVDRAELLLRRCARALRPSGTLVIVTPNGRDITVMGEVFWLDPTHVRPFPAPLISAMLEAEGFVSIEMRTPPVWPGRLREWPGWVVRKIALGRYFGSLNLVVVTRRPPAGSAAP
jgi:O-antigen chain-terminating methyltransferase